MYNDTPKGIIAIEAETPSIKTIHRENPVFYSQCVKMMLIKMSLMLNVKEGLKPEQLNVLPSLLLTEFGNLRLNDINLVCRGIMTGKYRIFERVDVEFFFNCVRQYDASDERIEARENWNRRNKHADKTINLPDEMHKDFKKIGTKPMDEKDFRLANAKAMEWNLQRKEQENDKTH